MSKPEVTKEIIRSIPLFSSLTDSELEGVLNSPSNGFLEVPAHTDIVLENEAGDCMYVIVEGVVDVRITGIAGNEVTIASLKKGEFFGEQALLPGSSGRRNASVRSLQKTTVFQISRDDVIAGIRSDPGYSTDVTRYENASNIDRTRLMLKGISLFRTLNDEDLVHISEWTELSEYTQGEPIVIRAEAGDFMYVILDGKVDVYLSDKVHGEVVLARLSKGHYFGEQALLPQSSGRRNANVRAATDVTLIRVAREYFRLVLNRDQKLELALQRVGETQRRRIAEALRKIP